MVNLTIDPAVDVTQACVRRRFRFSSCRACADVCPAQAFSLAQGQVSIDTTRCIACGDCLFVCPVDAITGIKPVKRFVQGDTLVGPFSLQAPTVDELLLWHSQYGIRFIDIAVERSAQWLMALAGLNLALRRYGEPGWSFKHVVGAEINASRRTLFHVSARRHYPVRRRAGETASQTGVFRVQRMRTRNQFARVQDVRRLLAKLPGERYPV
ncbi:polyferredoxin [Salmonella enterica subsp. enterica]|uniref:Polyferredoxin n=1 Tax=Salmonella enterica I TaxID=59201 RepID=A0A447TY35_SALET|nr:polyferredoxin [Salmonella enterica subsp. enterica]